MSGDAHTEAQTIAGVKQVELGRKVHEGDRESRSVQTHHLCTETEVRRHGLG